MKFILTFDWSPDTEERTEGIARFQKTGGLPPEGGQAPGQMDTGRFLGADSIFLRQTTQRLFEFAYIVGRFDGVGDNPCAGRSGVYQRLWKVPRVLRTHRPFWSSSSWIASSIAGSLTRNPLGCASQRNEIDAIGGPGEDAANPQMFADVLTGL
jgi:hypothetical protein